LTKYIWEINEEDIIYTENNRHIKSFFGSNVINGEEFLKCISRESYYMIFADIKAYYVGDNRININTYGDYLESNCQMILLCADSTFIDFYSKDTAILREVHKNCIDNNFEQVLIITEENNSRVRMVVW
jgi:hypothetical protein